MGRIRRGGYYFVWWIGDHAPRHVHVHDSDGKLLGRVVIVNGQPLNDWKPPQKVLRIIQELVNEGRL